MTDALAMCVGALVISSFTALGAHTAQSEPASPAHTVQPQPALGAHTAQSEPATPAHTAQPQPASLTVSNLGNARFAAFGFVDVAAAPFGADPTGAHDATDALQRAVVFACRRQMVCFFPPGSYRISDTLRCEQYRPTRAPGRRRGTRDYPCVLIGSRQSERRPCIVLAPHSPGFDNPDKPKYVVHFFAMEIGTVQPLDKLQPNISMNQMFVGIDIIIGDCDRVRMFGYGGNAAATEGRTLFVVARTPNFLLANVVDSPRMPKGIPDTFFAGDGVDPRRWTMIAERTAAGEVIKTKPLERPVLYQRGAP